MKFKFHLILYLFVVILNAVSVNAAAEAILLECNIKGSSFDIKFEETIGIKISNGMIDIMSEEFAMFGPVEETERSFTAIKKFTNRGVKYFFSVELDRISGRFMAYETAAYPNRKIYNTTGSGPCVKVSAKQFLTLRTEQKRNPPMKVIIRSPDR